MENWLDFNTAKPQTFEVMEYGLSTDDIRQQLLSRLPEVLRYLLPAGRFESGVFKVGDIHGNQGDSLKVELNSGKPGLWHDFATGDGGDIFALWAACHRLDIKLQFPQVISSIQAWLGGLSSVPAISPEIPKPKPMAYDNLGPHTAKWDYLNADGKLIACVYRYDLPQGKTFRVWDAMNHKFKSPLPRPLYNQPGIKDSEQVVLVEGEKAANALITQGIAATTAMNGANAPLDKTDWSPLQNKRVLIWPDKDKPGWDYAKAVSRYLIEKGIAASVRLLNIPKDKPEKWDAYDAVVEKMDIKNFLSTEAIIPEVPPVSMTKKIATIKASGWKGIAPSRQWLIEEWLPCGYVTALYGDGGIGKSLLAQQLMTCVASGKPWLGFETIPLRVYGLMCEDDEAELWRRQEGINQALGLTMEELDELYFSIRVGTNNFFMTFDGKDTGKPTDFFKDFMEEVMTVKPQLVVLDTAADLFGGNEINRSQVRQFIQNACAQIAREIQGAVLLCAHPSDSGIHRGTGTGGSTAWNNTVRSRWYLTRSTEEDASPNERILSRKKSNYAALGANLHLQWHKGAFIQFTPNPKAKCVVGDKLALKRDAERGRKAEVILGLIASEALEGRVYSSATFAQKFEANPYRLGSESTIKRSIERYAVQGLIKFNQSPEAYGLEKSAVSQGYLCVEGMQLATGKYSVNPQTGENEPELVPFYPTHFKSERDSCLHQVEDPTIWIEKNKLLGAQKPE